MSSAVYEKAKLFIGESIEAVEEAYGKWYKELCDIYLSSTLRKPLEVIERKVAVHVHEKGVTVVIAVFYKNYVLDGVDQGDQGGHLDGSGISSGRPSTRRRR